MATIAVGQRGAVLARSTTDRAVLRDLPRAGPAVRRVRDLRPRGPRVRPDEVGDRDVGRRGRRRRARVRRPHAAAPVRDGPARRDRGGAGERRPAPGRVPRRQGRVPARRRAPSTTSIPGPPMIRMWVDRARFQPSPAAVERLLPGRGRRAQPAVPARVRGVAAVEHDRRGRVLRHPRQRAPRVGRRHPRVSRNARLAVVGNVLTHSDHRGRGYAKAVTSAVTAELLRFCDQVVLNVRSDNPPAIAAYRPSATSSTAASRSG